MGTIVVETQPEGTLVNSAHHVSSSKQVHSTNSRVHRASGTQQMNKTTSTQKQPVTPSTRKGVKLVAKQISTITIDDRPPAYGLRSKGPISHNQ